jgi:Protein of unknown function (DUF3102)
MSIKAFAVATQLEPDLTTLAATIRTAHQGITHAATNLVEQALAAGDTLIEAKAKVGHGHWLPWLKQYLRFPTLAARGVPPAVHGEVLTDGGSEALSETAPTGRGRPSQHLEPDPSRPGESEALCQ